MGVTWKANSVFLILAGNQPKKPTTPPSTQKAANVRFCIPFNKLFTVSVTRGKCMWAKRSAAGKGVEREQMGARGPLYWFVFTQFGQRNGGKKEKKKTREVICWLHRAPPFHFSSTRFMTFPHVWRGEIWVRARVLELGEIDTVSEIIGGGYKCTREKCQTSPQPTFTTLTFYSSNLSIKETNGVFQITCFCTTHLVFRVHKCMKYVHTEKYMKSALKTVQNLSEQQWRL